MYTIRRTATIFAVAVGVAAASAGLASAADGGSTGTRADANTAATSPAAPGAASSATGTTSDTTGFTVERGPTQSGTSATTQVDGSARNVAEGDDGTGGAWCATYRLAVVAGGEDWFGSVHIKSVCDQTHT
jgi:hypothetical protein